MIELRTCLCGGRPVLGHIAENTVVYCNSCGMNTGLRDTDEKAIAIWNKHNSIIVKCGECRWFNTDGYDENPYGISELQFGYCESLRQTMQACKCCSCGKLKNNEEVSDDS